jgi:translation initiation factor IF-3
MNQARRFLAEGNRVKVTVMFRGREMAYANTQRERLMEISVTLGDCSVLDLPPKVEGRNMSMMLNPKRGGAGGHAAPSHAKPDNAPDKPAVQPAAAAPGSAAAPPAAAPHQPLVQTRGHSQQRP